MCPVGTSSVHENWGISPPRRNLYGADRKERLDMATTDKAKNSAQQAKGKLKEAAGALSGNDKLRAEGKVDQTKGNLKQAGEKVKDAFSK